ncbi:MAG: ATP-dependent DNA ligase [bacterium]
MLFKDLVKYFGRIEATSLRNEKTVILAEILKEANQQEVDKLIYLSLGGLRPAFDRLEFNLAEKMIVRSLGVSFDEYQKIGDLGELAKKILNPKFSNSQITINDVYAELEKIARDSGSGSQERKVERLAKLIKQSDAESAKYIVRIVAGKLRLGFSDKTIIDALSYSEKGTKEYSDLLDRAYQIRPDVGVLAQLVKEKGVMSAIESMKVAMGTPIVPALAQRLKTPVEMIEKMGKVYCEGKFDGTRVQIHFSRKMENRQAGEYRDSPLQGLFTEEKPKFWVRTFTRNLDESSAMFPELQRIADQIKADEVILDSEAVGYDPKTGKLVPFQLTITRKRKHGIEETASSVPLRFFVFDIMYKDGASLIKLPLKERRRILSETVVKGEVLVVDDYVETDDPNVLREYHKQQLAEGLEGALVKQVDGEYMPGRTGFNWVKFKEAEDSRAKLSDTIDGVIMGYYLGKGKRSDFGLGAFLVGVIGKEQKNENIEHRILTLAKVGTGITDEMFGELRERLEKIRTKNKNIEYSVPKILEPDVWVEPKVVVEVAADEITVSPTHTAGYALRFPRLVKFRDDKSVEQITTQDEIETMFSI